MAKRRRTAKQKAATRKLVALNRRRSAPKRRRSSPKRKTNKRRRSSSSMAKRRRPSRRSPGKRSVIDRVPILKNKTVQRIGFGLGMGSIATIAAQNIPVPMVRDNAQLIGTGVSFATDPLSGVVRLALSGGLGQIGNLFSGGNSNGGGGGGFA